MRFSRLEMENVKRIIVARVNPRPGMNVLTGRNGAGKSSFEDGIQYLIGGAKTHPPRVIRDGESEALVIGETDEFIATRRWWKNGDGSEKTEVEVRAKDGSKLSSPQKILDRLYNETAFDPAAFVRRPPEEVAATLRKLAGVDTTALDAERDRVYAERTSINRTLSATQGRLKGMTSDAPPPRIDTAALMVEQKELSLRRAALQQTRAELDAAARRMTDTKAHVSAAEKSLQIAQEGLEAARGRAAAALDEMARADNAFESAEEAAAGLDQRFDGIAEQLQKASAIEVAHARWAERERVSAEAKGLERQSNAQTQKLDDIGTQKDAMVAAAKFPVKGLGFDETGVTLDGFPLEQASQAQRLRLSVAIAVALNPKLRVALVREGSFLDEEGLALLEQLCEEYDLQAFVETVSNGGAAAVVFEDGQIKGSA